MTTIHRYKRAMTIVLLLAVFLVSACGNDAKTANDKKESNAKAETAAPANTDKAASAGAAELDLTKVTLVVGQTGWGNFEAGFQAAGVDNTPYKVEYQVFQGGNLQLEAMAAKHLDLALTSEIPPIFASLAANGGNFKIIAVSQGTTLQQEIVIPKDSPIKTVADLKGKKVAYVKATTAHYFLLKILENAGLTWGDIEPVELSTADGLSALISGSVDALASYGNAIITSKQKGATTLASAKDILSGNFPVATTPANIEDPLKHAAIVDYLKRINQFHEWARAHEQEWAEIVAKATKQDVTQALETYHNGEQQRPTKIIPTSPEAIASQQDVADALTSVGLLSSKIDASQIWSNAFDDELK
ncbi:ABC transporter substrate-binding protein [Paenibacillus sp. NPDC058174]|uniref:ABC transporter substrate-binding protein n=1 Tax=Paenibacillus sp. NPDC058174 TaxID=3346366 RepID=UPI0036DE44A3